MSPFDYDSADPPHYQIDPLPFRVLWGWCGWPGVKGHLLYYLARAGNKPGNSLLAEARKMRALLDRTINELEREDNDCQTRRRSE